MKALRRPTVAAWAVNQLRHEHPEDLDALVELGDRLRRAQSEALSGRGSGQLKELSVERRNTVDALSRKAAALLGGDAHAQRDAIVATLDAAIASKESAELVQQGRLAKELPAPSGFGDDVFGGEIATTTTATDKDDRAERRRQQELDEKRGALRDAVDEVHTAERAARNAQEEVDRLKEALNAAKDRADEAEERLRLAHRREQRAREALD